MINISDSLSLLFMETERTETRFELRRRDMPENSALGRVTTEIIIDAEDNTDVEILARGRVRT